MAKDAVSASILKSNLDLLKREGSELLSLFDDVNKKAASLGTNMSSSVRSVVGEINRLESSLSGLQSRLQRLTSTGSAIGAANISGALGQLTGQGRSYGGGGAYGGGGGGGGIPMSGALFNRGFGSAAGNIIGGAANAGGGWISKALRGRGSIVGGKAGKLLRVLGGAAGAGGAAAKKAAQLAGAGIDMSTGMGMAALGQIYGTGLSAEKAKLYGAGLGPQGRGASGFSEFKSYGIGGLEAYSGYEQPYQQAGGYLGKGYSGRIATTVSGGHAAGFDPRQGLGLVASQRALGGSGAVSLQRLTQSINLLQNVVKSRYGAGPNTSAGRAYGKEAGPFLVNAAATLSGMQAAQGVGNQASSGARSLGFAGLLAQNRNFSAQQAGSIAAQLGQSTFSPGGGDAGQLFQMRAYGFGNPNLGAYQDQARKMGIDPGLFKRRGYYEYKRFKEGDITSKIQAQLVGMSAEGRGNQEYQADMLSNISGVSFTQSEAIVKMAAEGGASNANIQKILSGKGTAGTKAFGLSGEVANLENQRLSKSTVSGMVGLSKAMSALQSVQYNAVTKGVTDLTTSFTELGAMFAANEKFITVGMSATVDMVALLIKALSTAGKLGK